MATLRLFAGAREAAGTGRDELPGATVGELLDEATRRYGPAFAEVLATAQVWRNGEPAEGSEPLAADDEVAVLPPVSGGSEAVRPTARSRSSVPADRARRPSGPRPAAAQPVGLGRSLAGGLVGSYHVDGPRIRLGLLWAVVALVAVAFGPWPLALVLAAVAGAAALQTAAAWRRLGGRANRLVAGLSGLGLPLAAAVGTGALGLAALVAVLAAVVAAGVDPRRIRSIWADAGLTLRCGYAVGLAAGSLVVIRHLEIGAAISLLVLGMAYDLGDFLIGTEAGSPVEGPIAGIVATMVVAFALGVFSVPPFDLSSALIFGGLAAAVFPLGQLAATELLPAADARAPALRRLDSFLLAAPLWMGLLWRYLG